MKRFIKTALTAVLAVTAVACTRELVPQKENINGTIDLSFTGVINGYTSYEETKAEAQTVVRIMWKGDETVYVFDGTKNLGSLTASIEGNDSTYAKLSGTIEETQATNLTFVYSPQFDKAPDVTGGKISLDLSTQDDEKVPFLIYATLPTAQAPATFSNEVVQFNLATSVFKCNCAGLGEDGDISLAEISGVNTKCELTLSDSGAPEVSGSTPGTITRTAGFTQADQRAIFSVALPKTDASAERNILVHQNSKVFGAPFSTIAFDVNKSYNTVYELGEYVAPPAGILPGEFTVNESGKKVHFSKGNLYCKRTSSTSNDWTWHFYDEQYQYNSIATTSGSRTAASTDTEIDLFYWGYGDWSTDPISEMYLTNHTLDGEPFDPSEDWGSAIDDKGTWRTLTTAEWQYLFNNHNKKWITVCGKTGYAIAPDGVSEDFIESSYETDTDWKTAQDAGIVFLPAAGVREDGSDVHSVGDGGLYWSSTAYVDNCAYVVFYSSDQVQTDSYNGRNLGHSVRLVTDASDGYSPAVKVDSVTLNKSEIAIEAGAKDTLAATVTPTKATHKEVTWSSSKTSVATVDSNGEVTGVAAGSAVITATTADGNFTAVCLVTVVGLPDGALRGVFTVSDPDGTPNSGDEKKVHFSKGNLYYDGINWGFEAEQYYFRTYNGYGKCDAYGYDDYIEDGESGTTSGHWGLFGWVGESSSFTTPPEIYGVSISTDNYGNDSGEALKADWGKTIDDKGTWTTLTGGDNGEWKYLFDHHVHVWGTCTCNEVPGLFIAPDGFVGGTDALKEAIKDWDSAQADGIVFLPAAGYRGCYADVNELGYNGYYWSSTAETYSDSYCVSFGSDGVSPDTYHHDRLRGSSVRLVTEVK